MYFSCFLDDAVNTNIKLTTLSFPFQLFNYRSFIEKINYVCHPAKLALDSEDKCLAMCVVHLCFVKNSDSDDGAPCWVEVVLTRAVQYVKRK